MVIRCLCCGSVLEVGSFWQETVCPRCGRVHRRLDRRPRWSVESVQPSLEVWLCWSCGLQFEAWRWIERAPCPHCGCFNYPDSVVVPVVR